MMDTNLLRLLVALSVRSGDLQTAVLARQHRPMAHSRGSWWRAFARGATDLPSLLCATVMSLPDTERSRTETDTAQPLAISPLGCTACCFHARLGGLLSSSTSQFLIRSSKQAGIYRIHHYRVHLLHLSPSHRMPVLFLRL